MAANACKASNPVGMGFLQFNGDQKFEPAMFELPDDKSALHLDYVGGRMVKLNIWSDGAPGAWKMRDQADPEFQSWCRTYPTAAALIESVGAKVLPATEPKS